ncbi:MAG: hypothetical protein RDU01_06070 [Thermodesulfovibrionales bacterium]|nr:hypothetical protein [Thermodesulfovibrionales bacterium]
MKTKKSIMAILIICSFLLITWLPCQAEDVLCGCAKTKKGTLRLIDCSSQCLKSEYPVTFSGISQQNQNPIPYFEGTLCWAAHITEDENGLTDGNFLFKMDVTYLNGDYYIVQGVVDVPSDYPNVFNGGALVKDNNIIFNLVGSQEHVSPYRDSGISQARLDKTTLNGTFWSNYMSFNTSTREAEDTNYSAGTLTLTTCP